MGEFALSLIGVAVTAIVKTVVTVLIKHVLSRFKERTAPINGRDGSKK